MVRTCRGVLVLALVLTSARVVCAQATPDRCLDELDDAEVRSRLDWLDGRFQAGKRRARLWWYGQMALWLGVATFQTTMTLTSDEPVLPNAIGSTGAWLSFVQITAVPHVAAFAPQRFRRHADDTPEARLAKLRYGLDLLERAATRQELAAGPMAHLPVFLWSAGFGTFFSVKYKDWWLSTRMIGGGILLSEFRILSTPQAAVRDWERARGMMCGAGYVRRDYDELEDLAPGTDALPEPEVALAPSPGGLGMRVVW
ncbi:MAG: hypothetical protein H6721_05885 [Sandaracinus sp.]|nr:hypothetical protein [Sandaracinus sp.]